MYQNLLNAMKEKGVTSTQLAKLLNCRQATISEKINGVVACGFSFDEAARIRNGYFKEYSYDYLFQRSST